MSRILKVKCQIVPDLTYVDVKPFLCFVSVLGSRAEGGLQLFEGRAPLLPVLLLSLLLLLLFPDLSLELTALRESLRLGLKEVLGSHHSLCGDVDLRESSQSHEAALLLQLSGCRTTENQQELSEAEFSVEVLVHFFDHVFESEVSLRSPEFLHHQLQLHQINEAVSASVVPLEHGLHIFYLFAGELLKFGVRVEDTAESWGGVAIVDIQPSVELGGQFAGRVVAVGCLVVGVMIVTGGIHGCPGSNRALW